MKAKDSRLLGLMGAVAICIGLLFVFLLAGKTMPVLMPQGIIADQQKLLIQFTVVLSSIVVLPVFAMLGMFAWRYREGNSKHVGYRPEWSSNYKLETIWWGIPIVIISVLSVVTYITSHSLDPYRAIASDKQTLEVQVVALQWKWLFIYPEYGVASVNNLSIPVDTPVHFRLSADAPMSAFWVPALGSQIYSMNSMSSQLNLMANNEGVFKGYNTNINGSGYADMTFDVHSLSDKSFDNWLESARRSESKLDWASYQKLAMPATSDQKVYTLADENLYRKIIMKNMGSDNDAMMDKAMKSDNEAGKL